MAGKEFPPDRFTFETPSGPFIGDAAADLRDAFIKGYTRGQQDRWISVKDRLPKEGDHVLATDGENVVEVMYCRYGADPRTTLAFRRTAIGPVLDDVTQWCELPSPPNPEQR